MKTAFLPAENYDEFLIKLITDFEGPGVTGRFPAVFGGGVNLVHADVVDEALQRSAVDAGPQVAHHRLSGSNTVLDRLVFHFGLERASHLETPFNPRPPVSTFFGQGDVKM